MRQLGLSYSTSSLIKSDASISFADKRTHAIDDLQHLFSSSSSSVTCSRSQHSCLLYSIFCTSDYQREAGALYNHEDLIPDLQCTYSTVALHNSLIWKLCGSQMTHDCCARGGFVEEIWTASVINSIKVSQSPHLFCCKSLSWSCTEAAHDCLLESSQHYLCPIGNV